MFSTFHFSDLIFFQLYLLISQIFLSLRVLAVPRIPPKDQLLVDRIRSFKGMFSATLRLGYMDSLDLQNFGEVLVTEISELEASTVDPPSAGEPTLEQTKVVSMLKFLRETSKHITHV